MEADCSAPMSLSGLLDCKGVNQSKESSVNKELIVSFRIFACVYGILIWTFNGVFSQGWRGQGVV